MAEKVEPKISESYVSMALGAIVVLVIGVLIFNYFSKINKTSNEQGKISEGVQTTASPTPASKATSSENLVTLSNTSSEQSYTVAAGDSLWKISEKFYGTGFNWKLIASANNLVNPRVIHSGNTLRIPDASTAKLPATGIVTASITGTTYVVAKGDTLWNIAVRSYGDGFAWDKISKANNNVDPRSLKIGMSLNIPR